MRSASVNTLIVCAAVVGFLLVGHRTGRVTFNGGLGWDGSAYAAMVTDHDVTRGSASTRLVPAFPLAGAVASSITGDIVGGFALVNLAALALWVLAACLIADTLASPVEAKVVAALTLVLLGLPTASVAFNPVQPDLLAVALVTMAVAVCAVPWFDHGLVGRIGVAAVHVAATLASPAGIIAPLYGLWRSWRVRRRDVLALGAFAPALVAWLLVQFWARGGAAGLVNLVRPGRVAADAGLWREGAFAAFGLYSLTTGLGGLTVMLLSNYRAVTGSLRARSELYALLVPALLFVATAGLDVPRVIPLFVPFWLIVLGDWARRTTHAQRWFLLVATVLTVVTQRPWARLDDSRYFVDWFPYSVHAHRVDVVDDMLWRVWRMRMFVVVAGFLACAGLRRLTGRIDDPEAGARG